MERKASAVRKATDAPKEIEDRMPADQKETVSQREIAARMAIAPPRAAALTVNAVTEIEDRRPVVLKGIAPPKANAPKETAHRKGIVVPRHEVRKDAVPREPVVRMGFADRYSFASSTRTTTVASRRMSWPSWRTSLMNSTPITTDSSIRPSCSVARWVRRAMAMARVPVIADLKVTARRIVVSMETDARKVIVARKAVVLKGTADQKVIAAPMLVALKANVVIPFAVSDLVLKVKIAARNVNNREMVKSRATENDPLPRPSSYSQQAPSEIVRTGPSHFVIDASIFIAIGQLRPATGGCPSKHLGRSDSLSQLAVAFAVIPASSRSRPSRI